MKELFGSNRETTSSRALFVLDGELPSGKFINKLRHSHRTLIAADGAALQLYAMDIIPDIVIGDMDGMGADHPLFQSSDVTLVHIPDQEQNDFDKGILWMIESDINAATILGIGGGMVDHTLNNFSILAKYSREVQLEIRDERSIGFVVTDQLIIPTSPGERISLIPLPTAIVTTKGLEWELEKEELAFAVREGASNRTVSSEIRLTIYSGTILVVHYPS